MSKFTSTPQRVERPAHEISEKFSDLSQLQTLIDQLPEEERAKLGDVEFTDNSIKVKTAQVGAICFEVIERTDNVIRFKAAGAPVDVELLVELNPVTDTATDVNIAIEMQIPMMLRPMIAPHMQKAVDMLGNVIARVAEK